MVAVDRDGQPLSDAETRTLQARVDGQLATLSLAPGRPTIALTTAFLLDSSATPQVRDAVANAVADGLRAIDVNRDAVAIASTADPQAWDQVGFSTSAADVQARLNQVIQTEPDDGGVSLDQVSGALRALSTQQRDTRVLLLITNHPLASAATAAASLGTTRTQAVDNGVQIGVIALSGAGGQGVAEALAEPTPNGRVEYALNATNRADLSRRVSSLLAPAFGARRFDIGAQTEGSHTLTISQPGTNAQVSAPFSVATRAVSVDALETTDGPLSAGAEIREPIWVQARPAEAAPIDSVEWTLDGRVSNVTSAPWALLLDPEQIGDGPHDLAARIVSQGRAGPYATATVDVPPDLLRSVRAGVRSWGLITVLLVANLVVLGLLLRLTLRGASATAGVTEFPPTLRLNALTARYVAPEVLHFPSRGKVRVGYHPPYMDNHVGSREFTRLPFQDVRGDEDAVKDLSRHVGCIWRDPKTNDCFVQLGWPGPGEPISPKPQTQVFHFGRPQDATTEPFRLAHHDVVRLATGIEFVFNQVGLRDKATPESRKLTPLESRGGARPPMSLLSE